MHCVQACTFECRFEKILLLAIRTILVFKEFSFDTKKRDFSPESLESLDQKSPGTSRPEIVPGVSKVSSLVDIPSIVSKYNL